MSKFTLGIEITDQAIKAVEMSKNNSGSKQYPYQFRYWIEQLPENTVVNGKIIDSILLINTLRTLLDQMKPRTHKVQLIVPTQSILVRFLKFPDLPIKKLRKIIKFEVTHNIHLPFNNSYYDFIKFSEETKNRDIKNGSKKFIKAIKEAAATSETLHDEPMIDVMLVAAPVELLNQYVKAFKVNRLKPKSMEIKALSLYRVMETFEILQPDKTVLVMDINKNFSDFSIFDNGQLKITRNVPLQFSNENFHYTCNELSQEVERLMNFYRYKLTNQDTEFDYISLSGDVDRITDIFQFLKDRTSLNVSLLYSSKIIPMEQLDKAIDESLFASLAVPLGLALRGYHS